ncbi:S8 family peptidase [Paenibacillus sp. WLX1005]|uniref:S8 family peptidase n=1 Tax=Paenibacillus sp. WLX1005 TaxID=3243766 RepID=UPI0039843B3C
MLPSSGLKTFSDQEIVLGIKKTPFFGTKQEGGGQNEIDLTDVAVHFPDDPKNLPVICILDDGVFLPESMKDCIAGRYVSPDLKYPPTCEHGTKVASRAIFGDDIDKQVQQKKLIPKVRIIDAAINDGRSGVGESTLINRIRSAVESIKEQAQIFCLSMNAEEQISEDSVGNLAYVLDSLTKEYEEDNIQFVVPTGNHKLWTYYTEFADIIDDDSSRIAAPSESFHALTIGSISRDEHQYSISKKLEISPFSRIGFGFGGCNKPDLVYPGGNVYINNNKGYISANSAAYVINNQGKLCQDFGTSFAAPIGAQELALLREQVPYKNIRIAKSLLLHHADTPHIQLYESSKETRELHSRMYGKGMGNYDSARSSFRSRATYLREGKMSRLTKQRVRFYMPSTIASYSNTKQPVIKVSITCVTFSKVDQSKGGEYLRSYIDASLHKINSNNNSTTDNPPGKEGRQPWHHVHHFSQVISSFNPGDWEIWLHLFTKPELSNEEEIPYILLVSIEDLTNNDVDIHGGISLETESRFEILNEVEIEANELNLDNGNY